jgi:hypothetical protein
MTAYRMLVFAHIGVGAIALATFWIAGFARKGSPLHKLAGKGYLTAMLGILASALPMGAVFFARGNVSAGVFFAYLVVITGTSVWISWRAIRLKREIAVFHNARYRQVGWLNLLAGIAVFAIGLQQGSVLLSLFCWIGVFAGVSMLRQARTPPTARNWWLREHYGAMLGNGVATHVAFLGIGMSGFLKSFGIAWLQLVPWFAPVIVAVIVGLYLDRKYAPKGRVVGNAVGVMAQ